MEQSCCQPHRWHPGHAQPIKEGVALPALLPVFCELCSLGAHDKFPLNRRNGSQRSAGVLSEEGGSAPREQCTWLSLSRHPTPRLLGRDPSIQTRAQDFAGRQGSPLLKVGLR